MDSVHTRPPATMGAEPPPDVVYQRVWNDEDESMLTAAMPSAQGTYTTLPLTARPPNAALLVPWHTAALKFSPPPGFELPGSAAWLSRYPRPPLPMANSRPLASNDGPIEPRSVSLAFSDAQLLGGPAAKNAGVPSPGGNLKTLSP